MKPFLHPSEELQFAVKTIRTVGVVTTKRILLAAKQGITGKKKNIIPSPSKIL